MGLMWLHRVLKEGKAEAVLKPHVIQDALADVAKEQSIPELLNAPIAKHLSHCQEVDCHWRATWVSAGNTQNSLLPQSTRFSMPDRHLHDFFPLHAKCSACD